MTERMSDERFQTLLEEEVWNTNSLDWELWEALRAERATVERLTKVAEQMRGLGAFRLDGQRVLTHDGWGLDFEDAPELAAYLREKENT